MIFLVSSIDGEGLDNDVMMDALGWFLFGYSE